MRVIKRFLKNLLPASLLAWQRSVRRQGSEILGLRPRIRVSKSSLPLRNLGSTYGGWTFVDMPSLNNSVIISCGAGEDISFDLEFSKSYNARVLIIDPTPRAVEHVKSVLEQLESFEQSGGKRTLADKPTLAQYGDGKFPSFANLHLIDKALWHEKTSIKLYAPPNGRNVSHSAHDYLGDYEKSGPAISVDTVTLSELQRTFQIDLLPILKLDIEGAEIEVILGLTKGDRLPIQISVEYDELFTRTRRAKYRVEAADSHLRSLGYRAVWSDNLGLNFLYVAASVFSGKLGNTPVVLSE